MRLVDFWKKRQAALITDAGLRGRGLLHHKMTENQSAQLGALQQVEMRW